MESVDATDLVCIPWKIRQSKRISKPKSISIKKETCQDVIDRESSSIQTGNWEEIIKYINAVNH